MQWTIRALKTVQNTSVQLRTLDALKERHIVDGVNVLAHVTIHLLANLFPATMACFNLAFMGYD